MPDTAPMAPPRRTAVPIVHGPQTAMVVGDGEIDCDEYRPHPVRFHWDLEGALFHALPGQPELGRRRAGRRGHSPHRHGGRGRFLDGDPDKPLVTGCVFNGQNDAPYPLPDSKTKAVWRSNTHQGQGFNEISFEDQAGREMVYLHAQRDHNTDIGHDETHSIAHDRSKTVGNNQTETIGANKTITVGTDHTESIGANMTLSVGGNQTEAISGDMNLAVSGAQTRNITGTDATTVSEGDQTVTVTRGKQEVQVLAAGQYTTVNNDIVTVSRAGGVRVKAATCVVLEAPSIMLRASDTNYILVTQGQVVIEGAETFINPREAAPEL
jgi:type VI secretion system secreted protein VgrG